MYQPLDQSDRAEQRHELVTWLLIDWAMAREQDRFLLIRSDVPAE
jgi:hypothetical protein